MWRDPDLYPILLAALMSMATAFIRNLYDGGKSIKTYALESFLIGSTTVGVGFALKALGADGAWVYFAGSMIGLLGIDYVRLIGKRGIERRLEK